MRRNQLYSVLEKNGVKEMESVLGKEFDPETMESLAQVTDPSKKDQEVTAVYKKGYYFKDRVLRHAQVIVNVLPVENTENKEE